MPELVQQITIACPPQLIFDFITRPRQAELLSPPDLKVDLIDPPDVLGLGTRVNFLVEVMGFKQNFVHEVTLFEAPGRFTETQQEGPFKQFVHDHVLEEGPHGTTLIEHITFQPPSGMAALLLTEKRIRERLVKSITFGHAELKRRMEAT